MTISFPGSEKGSGRSNVVLIKLKMTVFAPIPKASDKAATMVKPGFFISIQQP